MKRAVIIGLTLFIVVFLAFQMMFTSVLINDAIYLLTDKSVTLEDVLEAGELTVLTRNNSHCYYLYREEPMGFEYELLKAFADHLGVRLNIEIVEKWEGLIPGLLKGRGAVVAASMTNTEKRRRKIAFSDPYMKVHQYIVVHRNNAHIKSTEDLNGREVHVRKGTSYHEQLLKLKKDGIDIKLALVDDVPTEELIRQVHEQEIEVTIADTNVALMNQRYYPEIVLTGIISRKQYLGWAVSPGAPRLLEEINAFFRKTRGNGLFAEIYNRYYQEAGVFDYVDLWRYRRSLNSRMPRFSVFINNAADKYGLDWRLLTAQIYQESHFRVQAKSHFGAYGLMQLTRTTAKALGVKDIYDPEENIIGGARHLKFLYDYFDRFTGDDRLYVALAAYNIGHGHVRDAQRLAKKMNLDPLKWSSLTRTLPMLKFKKYYQKTQFGYCRGDEPVTYVQRIRIYYDILKRQAIENIHVPP
ncbi:MAG: membrane-bound lytic murein transglycosylase MltF [Desulfobacteraceae bacterium]|nr:membrane-bound lytic murein transglycosylase MltF [Desulfobacteraceae bacterium]